MSPDFLLLAFTFRWRIYRTAHKLPCFSMPLSANTFIPPIVSKPIRKLNIGILNCRWIYRYATRHKSAYPMSAIVPLSQNPMEHAICRRWFVDAVLRRMISRKSVLDYLCRQLSIKGRFCRRWLDQSLADDGAGDVIPYRIDAWLGDWSFHQSLWTWAESLMGNQHLWNILSFSKPANFKKP